MRTKESVLSEASCRESRTEVTLEFGTETNSEWSPWQFTRHCVSVPSNDRFLDCD